MAGRSPPRGPAGRGWRGLDSVAVSIAIGNAVAGVLELGAVEPGLLLLYIAALVPPVVAFRKAAPGSRDRLGGLGVILVQALLGVGAMWVFHPMEMGFARGVGDLLSSAAVVGIGFLTLLVLIFRKPAPGR